VTAIVELEIAGDRAPWRRLGLDIDENGCTPVGTVWLRIGDHTGGPSGIIGWTLTGDRDEMVDIDGLPTRLVVPAATTAPMAPASRPHSLPVERLDHVVVVTPSLERTCAALEATTGEALRRVRDAGPAVRQGFHRFGEVIVEVVERSDLDEGAPAVFWGLRSSLAGIYSRRVTRSGPTSSGCRSPPCSGAGSSPPCARSSGSGYRSR
jgi:hypothetical protein